MHSKRLMGVSRRSLIQGASVLGGSAVLGLRATGASAADYPARPINLVVPFAPGGVTDLVARMVAEELAKTAGQSVVVENRGGAGGTIATLQVFSQPADGYTLLFASSGQATTGHLYKDLGYDAIRDFTTVALVSEVPMVLVVPASMGVTDLAGFIEKVRSEPDKHTYGTSGVGTVAHIACAAFADEAGISALHIPYQGSGPAITDLLAARVSYMIDGVAAMAQHIRSGALVGLAMVGKDRSAVLPDVPTVVEAGLPAFAETNWNPWNAFHARTGTPADAVTKLNGWINQALASPAIQKRFDELNLINLKGSTPEGATAFIAEQSERLGAVIRKLDIAI